MRGSIYKISSTKTNKVYIGQTIKDYIERYKGHLTILNNGGDTYLYRAMKKYGISTFSVELLETDILLFQNLKNTQNSLDLREQFWIKHYNSFNKGYNMNEGGSGTLGMKHSDETKKIISEKNKGKKRTQEVKDAISKKQLGKKHSEETKQKMSEWHTGKVVTEETKEKIRQNNLGKKHSEETKQKMSENNWMKGRKMDEEHRQKLIKINTGSVHSDESKQKMSKSIKEARKGNLNYFKTYEIYNSKDTLIYTVNNGLKKFLQDKNLPISLMDTYRKNSKLYSSNSGLKRAKTLGYTEFIGWYIISK